MVVDRATTPRHAIAEETYVHLNILPILSCTQMFQVMKMLVCVLLLRLFASYLSFNYSHLGVYVRQ